MRITSLVVWGRVAGQKAVCMPAFSICDVSETTSGGNQVKEVMSAVKEVSYNLASLLPVLAAIDVQKR